MWSGKLKQASDDLVLGQVHLVMELRTSHLEGRTLPSTYASEFFLEYSSLLLLLKGGCMHAGVCHYWAV